MNNLETPCSLGTECQARQVLEFRILLANWVLGQFANKLLRHIVLYSQIIATFTSSRKIWALASLSTSNEKWE
jgi:hypothetical protein